MTRRTVAAALALAVAATSCGGPDAAEFRRTAERLCAAEDRVADERGVQAARSTSELAAALERARRAARPIQGEFAALEPPDELATAHRDYVRLNDDGDRLLRRVVAGLRSGREEQAAAALTELQRAAPGLTRRADAISRRLGVPACGEGPAEDDPTR